MSKRTEKTFGVKLRPVANSNRASAELLDSNENQADLDMTIDQVKIEEENPLQMSPRIASARKQWILHPEEAPKEVVKVIPEKLKIPATFLHAAPQVVVTRKPFDFRRQKTQDQTRKSEKEKKLEKEKEQEEEAKKAAEAKQQESLTQQPFTLVDDEDSKPDQADDMEFDDPLPKTEKVKEIPVEVKPVKEPLVKSLTVQEDLSAFEFEMIDEPTQKQTIALEIEMETEEGDNLIKSTDVFSSDLTVSQIRTSAQLKEQQEPETVPDNDLDMRGYDKLDLEQIKNSELQVRLEEFKHKQIVLQMYTDQIAKSSQSESYERRTLIGAPDQGQPIKTDEILCREEQIDDYHIQQYYVNGTTELASQTLTMDIKSDMHRLFEMHLEVQTNLKLALPSENVENRFHERVVTNVIPKSKGKDTKNNRDTKRDSSLDAAMTFTNRQSTLGSKSSRSTTSLSSMHTSVMTETKQTIITRHKQQATPKVIRIDETGTDSHLINSWQDFVTELQQNSSVQVEVVRSIMDGYDPLTREFDIRESTLLVNMSLYLFDSVHMQNRKAFNAQTGFVRFFTKFSKKYISSSDFTRNELGNVFIKEDKLKQTLMCLFEGLTNQQQSFNFLNFLYLDRMEHINFSTIEKELVSSQKQQLQRSSTTEEVKEEVKKKAPETPKAKGGFMNKLKGWWQSKEKPAPAKPTTAPKLEPKSQAKTPKGSQAQKIPDFDIKMNQSQRQMMGRQSTVKVGKEAQLSQSKNESTATITGTQQTQNKLYESMTRVYGDDSLQNSAEPGDLDHQARRIAQIEDRMEKERVNMHRYAMDDIKAFRTMRTHRIIQKERSSISSLKSSGSDKRPSKQSRGTILSFDKQSRNLTYYLKSQVSQQFNLLLQQVLRVPFAIRFMLKVLVAKSRNDIFTSKVTLQQDDVRMLADFMIAGWLNSGYRNARCFGVQPTKDKEIELEYVFFQAARIVFEHLMLMQYLPEARPVAGFDLQELNKFILDLQPKVFKFWSELINIDTSDSQDPDEDAVDSLMETYPVRIDDLELLYYHCYHQYHNQHELIQNYTSDEKKQHYAVDWNNFNAVMVQMQRRVQFEDYEALCFDEQQFSENPTMQQLIPKNQHAVTLSRHFLKLLECSLPRKQQDQHEYWLLFMESKSKGNYLLEKDLQESHKRVTEINSDFLRNKLIQNGISAVHEDPTKTWQFTEGEIVSQVKLPMQDIEATVLRVFNSIRLMLLNSQLIFERLCDQAGDETLNLCELLDSAIRVDKIQSKPNLNIQAGCLHIIKMVRKLNLEEDFCVQRKLLWYFCRLMDYKIRQSRGQLEKILVNIEELSVDVSQFESHIVAVRQFYRKFESQVQVSKTISKYTPKVCLLDCSSGEFLPPDNKHYQGILLNLQCQKHFQQEVKVGSLVMMAPSMQLHKSQQEMSQTQDGSQFQSQEDEQLNMVRSQRQQRFLKHHLQHTKLIKLMTQPREIGFAGELRDTPVKRIEYLIHYFLNDAKDYLRTLVSADPQKYRTLLRQSLVHMPDDLLTQNQRYEYLSTQEPLDYMNLVKTYTMFLHQLSISQSYSTRDDFVDKIADRDFEIKQHYDFLMFELSAKQMRYSVHSYIMRRLHHKILSQTTDMDIQVFELILKKGNNSYWMLTSKESRQDMEDGLSPSDFTETPEWCDPAMYKPSLDHLQRLKILETPHEKAICIDQAVTSAMNAMKIATPWKAADKYGEPERQRIMRYLILQHCQQARIEQKNPRFYSHLLFVLMFNVPHNEILTHNLIKKQSQYASQNENATRDYQQLPLEEQHDLLLSEIGNRNRVYEWFSILQALINDHRQAQQPEQLSQSVLLCQSYVQV